MTDPQIAEIAAKGMKPYGPSHPDYPNAPSDWDGGPYLCRDGGMYHMRGYGWEHGLFCQNATSDWDRVAYTPAVAAYLKEQSSHE